MLFGIIELSYNKRYRMNYLFKISMIGTNIKLFYTKQQVENSLKWMREKRIVPDGWGVVIERVKKKISKK